MQFKAERSDHPLIIKEKNAKIIHFYWAISSKLLQLRSFGFMNSHGADDCCHTTEVLFYDKGSKETLLEHAASLEGMW